MATGINTPLGYSAGNIAGFLPRSEIDLHPLFYEDALTSYPVLFNDQFSSPLIVANRGLYSKSSQFGKKKKVTTKKKKAVTAKKKSTTRKKKTVTTKKSTTRLRKEAGGSKRVSKTRKSPEASATTKKIGSVATGIDGNRWVVKKASNGVKRWSKIAKK
jgi:hypothetical protein